MTNTALLASLVAATQAGSFMWLVPDDYNPLVTAGLAEVNASVPGAPIEGQVATRATQAGVDAINNPPQNTGFGAAPATTGFGAAPQADGSSAASAPVEKKTVFTFVSDFQPPASKPRGAPAGADEKYPFGELKAPTQRADGSLDYNGAAIFVQSTSHSKGDKKGQLRTGEEMAFSLVSACSAANRRYAEINGTKTGADGKQRKSYNYTREFKSAPGEQNGQPGAYIYRAR